MGAGGGDFQGALGVLVATHVSEVHGIARGLRGHFGDGQRLDSNQPHVMGDELLQRLDGIDGNTFDDRGFGAVNGGDERLVHAGIAGGRHHWENAVCVANAAVQRQLTEVHRLVVVKALELPSGSQNRHGHRQVVDRAFLANVGGGQIHREAALGEDRTAVADGAAGTFAGFLNGRVG